MYPVPELTAILQSQTTLKGCFACDSDRGGQIYYYVILELDYFKFVWAFTAEACEMKHEIRGLTLLHISPGIRAPCVVSPLFSTLQCECLVILSQILSVLEQKCSVGVF